MKKAQWESMRQTYVIWSSLSLISLFTKRKVCVIYQAFSFIFSFHNSSVFIIDLWLPPSMSKDGLRPEINSLLRVFSLLVFAAILIKAFLPLDRHSLGQLIHSRLPQPMADIMHQFGITGSPSLQEASQNPISHPEFHVNDANPFDAMRLVCFSIVCLVICTPFFLWWKLNYLEVICGQLFQRKSMSLIYAVLQGSISREQLISAFLRCFLLAYGFAFAASHLS